ncbi:hypothetical protein DPMN_175592 [Dreissena polymorpha]|uniref:Uncharacterized protein n=1 Tax=Dreissena polymorpha TaxID=45954 RepID=A0A9D4IIW9_DREPO|nr:hypothetical protein DPMN_175592 [Dreissena polymorpha]
MKDKLHQLCEILPVHSNFNVDVLKGDRRLSKSAFTKANDFESCKDAFHAMIFDPGDKTYGNTISGKLVEFGIIETFPYSKDPSIENITPNAQIVILVVAPDVKLTVPIDNMGIITYILCSPDTDKSSWTTMATDARHVLHFREINTIMETLQFGKLLYK